MVVKTYRGKLADGGQHRIRLGTIKGKVGYRIAKFELFPYAPGAFTQESLVMITKTEQTVASPTNAITDFSDSDLLAAALYTADASGTNYPEDTVVVFDREVFNQDIYISHTDQATGAEINYYFELEVISLDDAGAEYTTLKDTRQRTVVV
jgi:hypothetical protein